jgi:hypothetical protein
VSHNLERPQWIVWHEDPPDFLIGHLANDINCLLFSKVVDLSLWLSLKKGFLRAG